MRTLWRPFLFALIAAFYLVNIFSRDAWRNMWETPPPAWAFLFLIPNTTVTLAMLAAANWITDWFGYPPEFFLGEIRAISPLITSLCVYSIFAAGRQAFLAKRAPIPVPRY